MIKPIEDSSLGPNQSRYSFVVGIANKKTGMRCTPVSKQN